ncbi:hypothetical protein IV203_012951 [Nitzschia inconspicua]|uniref:Uncharacterized protein n=1 Tax=Nitzschia inconspicua TaxID=303405 RepID=A0A9K3Q7M7_9STRA|nr:hypothetical protein IV203_012951 [Nitzschia inconspicua]
MSRKTRGQRTTTSDDEDEDPPVQNVSTNTDAQLLNNFLRDAIDRKADDDPIKLALKKDRIESIDMLLGLIYADIDQMTFDTQDGLEADGSTPKYKTENLPPRHKTLLVHLRTFIIYEDEVNGVDIQDDWTKFDKKKFKKYRISQEAITRYHHFKSTPVVTSIPVLAQPGPIQQNQETANKAIQDWKRGVKRDPTIFHDLSSDAIWESWNRSFTSTIGVQMLGHLLNSGYTPKPNTPKAAVFHLEREYVYDVLHRVVKTDKGREIVRAMISTNEIYQYLLNADITEWIGDAEKFLLHWFKQVRLYESNADPNAFLSDTQKLQLLANAVQGHPVLSLVQDQLEAITAYDPTKKPNIEQYKNLLFNAAVSQDRPFITFVELVPKLTNCVREVPPGRLLF